MTKAPKELLSLNTFSPDPLSGPYWPHSADAWSCGVADALQQLRHIFSRSQQRGSAVAAADDLLLNAVKTTPLSLSHTHSSHCNQRLVKPGMNPSRSRTTVARKTSTRKEQKNCGKDRAGERSPSTTHCEILCILVQAMNPTLHPKPLNHNP